MCDFCAGRGKIEDEYGEWELDFVKIMPLPAINLTTGEREGTVDTPYHALFLRYLNNEEDKGEHGSFPIRYCPVCGRELNNGTE